MQSLNVGQQVMKNLIALFLLVGSGLAFSEPTELSVTLDTEPYVWDLPDWLDPPTVPSHNPMTKAKVELGQHLFYEMRLSGPGYVACASCHLPERAFSGPRQRSVGVTGQFHTRNAQAIVNSAYMSTLTWANPALNEFEIQANIPIFGHQPIEMGTKGQEQNVIDFLEHNPLYQRLFAEAFDMSEGITFDHITQALSSFQRTLISYDSPYDRYTFEQQSNALSEQALEGRSLFFSKRLNCSQCHSGVHFSDATREPRFHNTGLYNEDGQGSYPIADQGLFEVTGLKSDQGKFRTPTLRNIALSAPYMHDGSIESLESVIEHYAGGGRSAINGAPSPLRSSILKPFELSPSETQALITFLNSLTDEPFITNINHISPFSIRKLAQGDAGDDY